MWAHNPESHAELTGLVHSMLAVRLTRHRALAVQSPQELEAVKVRAKLRGPITLGADPAQATELGRSTVDVDAHVWAASDTTGQPTAAAARVGGRAEISWAPADLSGVFMLQRNDVITKHQYKLHQRYLNTDSTVVPPRISQVCSTAGPKWRAFRSYPFVAKSVTTKPRRMNQCVAIRQQVWEVTGDAVKFCWCQTAHAGRLCWRLTARAEPPTEKACD